MTPKVETLAQYMTELDPAFADSRDVVAKKRAAIPAQFDATRAALTAEKGQGFNDINDNATGRGGSWSGIPADEQARYLATKYLPAYAQTYTDQTNADLALQSDLASLNKEQTTAAISRQDAAKSALNEWNLAQAQIAASSNNSADENASPDEAAIKYLDSMRGADGFVSPVAFRNARTLYLQAGGDNKTFMDRYWNYTGASSGQSNQNNWKSYYYGS